MKINQMNCSGRKEDKLKNCYAHKWNKKNENIRKKNKTYYMQWK
jgi:hypothetical protein